MKKPVFWMLCVFLLANSAWAMESSINAGPTQPDEKIQLVWLETSLTPKEISAGTPITVSARLTSPVKTVSVVFDFSPANYIGLQSADGMNWSTSYTIPSDLKKNLYQAKIVITDDKDNQISRSLDLAVIPGTDTAAKTADNLELTEDGWVLGLSNEVQVVIADQNGNNGGGFKKIGTSENLTGLYKALWYRVRLADGKEGWVMAARVNEPTDNYYQQGYYYYKNQDYANAARYYKRSVEIDSNFVNGHYWLAKTYWKLGYDRQAIDELKVVLTLDSGNMSAIFLSNVLAQEYYTVAHLALKQERYQDAVISFNKVLDLWPNSITTYMELGQAYSALGYQEKAQQTWMQVLKVDPSNSEALGLLRNTPVAATVKEDKDLAAEVASRKLVEEDEKAAAVSSLNGNDAIEIVRQAKTSKGTSVYSALRMVINLTKSLGTNVQERGWVVKADKGSDTTVTYICDQDRGASVVRESFEWVVDPKTKNVRANNGNAKMLMSSW